MYTIYEIQPQYSAIDDGLVGHSARRLPYTYQTEACARAIAGKLGQEEFDSFGDGHFVVRPVGVGPFSPVAVRPFPPVAASAGKGFRNITEGDLDELPF